MTDLEGFKVLRLALPLLSQTSNAAGKLLPLLFFQVKRLQGIMPATLQGIYPGIIRGVPYECVCVWDRGGMGAGG